MFETLTNMGRNCWVHDLSVSRLATLEIDIDSQCLEHEQKFANTTRRMTAAGNLNDAPSIDTRIGQKGVQLIFWMNKRCERRNAK
jgi:hypothetical protein